jgi:hypothetical protein
MSLKKTIAALALAASPFMALPAHAADPAQIAKDLQCLVGSWKGTGTFAMPDGKTANVSFNYDCKTAAGGSGVACHLRMTGIPGLPAYELDDLYGYNAGDGLVHWFTITNTGEVHDHKGGIDNSTFTGLYEGPVDGKIFQEQVSIQFLNEKKMRVRSSCKLGDKNLESLDVTATKG